MVFLLPMALFDLGALAVDLRDAELLAVETDLSGGEEVEDGFGRGAVAILQFGANVGEGGVRLRLRRCALYMRRRWFSSGM